MAEEQRRVTIKDIAMRTGLSVGTVHTSLAGKPGVKEETRRLVLEIAEEMQYRCNSVASSLKRGVTKIAVLLPSLTEQNQFYYAPIWAGVRAYCNEVEDFNIELVEVPYESAGIVEVPVEAIERVKEEEKLAGLIALGELEPGAKVALRALTTQGLPVALVNSDAPEVGRICCVRAEDYSVGLTMGEILLRQTPKGSSVLICAGDSNTPANADSTHGIEDYLSKHDPGRTVYKLNYSDDMQMLYRKLMEHLERNIDIASCCSVTARGSVQLAKALLGTGLAGKLPAIGTDVFAKNMDYLERGVFTNLMFKNPFRQGWLTAEQLFRYVIRNQKPEKDVIFVKSEVIFRSLAFLYK